MSSNNSATSDSSCQKCPAFSKSAFAKLDRESLDLLQNRKQQREFAQNQTFSEKGKPASEVYCLRSGSAKVHLTNPEGVKSIVRLVAPGDMLGYRCIFSSDTFRGTASAMNPSVACQISKDTIFQLIEKNTQFALELLSRMGKEIAVAEKRHQSFSQKNVRERLAEALFQLQEKFCDGEKPEVPILLTRKELANWIGAAKETVIRTLSDFKDEGLIEILEKSILILQPDRLKEIAEASLEKINYLKMPTEKFSPVEVSHPE